MTDSQVPYPPTVESFEASLRSPSPPPSALALDWLRAYRAVPRKDAPQGGAVLNQIALLRDARRTVSASEIQLSDVPVWSPFLGSDEIASWPFERWSLLQDDEVASWLAIVAAAGANLVPTAQIVEFVQIMFAARRRALWVPASRAFSRLALLDDGCRGALDGLAGQHLSKTDVFASLSDTAGNARHLGRHVLHAACCCASHGLALAGFSLDGFLGASLPGDAADASAALLSWIELARGPRTARIARERFPVSEAEKHADAQSEQALRDLVDILDGGGLGARLLELLRGPRWKALGSERGRRAARWGAIFSWLDTARWLSARGDHASLARMRADAGALGPALALLLDRQLPDGHTDPLEALLGRLRIVLDDTVWETTRPAARDTALVETILLLDEPDISHFEWQAVRARALALAWSAKAVTDRARQRVDTDLRASARAEIVRTLVRRDEQPDFLLRDQFYAEPTMLELSSSLALGSQPERSGVSVHVAVQLERTLRSRSGADKLKLLWRVLQRDPPRKLLRELRDILRGGRGPLHEIAQAIEAIDARRLDPRRGGAPGGPEATNTDVAAFAAQYRVLAKAVSSLLGPEAAKVPAACLDGLASKMIALRTDAYDPDGSFPALRAFLFDRHALRDWSRWHGGALLVTEEALDALEASFRTLGVSSPLHGREDCERARARLDEVTHALTLDEEPTDVDAPHRVAMPERIVLSRAFAPVRAWLEERLAEVEAVRDLQARVEESLERRDVRVIESLVSSSSTKRRRRSPHASPALAKALRSDQLQRAHALLLDGSPDDARTLRRAVATVRKDQGEELRLGLVGHLSRTLALAVDRGAVQGITALLLRGELLAPDVIEANQGGELHEALRRAHGVLLERGTAREADRMRELLADTLSLPTWWAHHRSSILRRLSEQRDSRALELLGLRGDQRVEVEELEERVWRGRPPPQTDLLAELSDEQVHALHARLLVDEPRCSARLRARMAAQQRCALHDGLLDALAARGAQRLRLAIDRQDVEVLAEVLFEDGVLAPGIREALDEGRLHDPLRLAHELLLEKGTPRAADALREQLSPQLVTSTWWEHHAPRILQQMVDRCDERDLSSLGLTPAQTPDGGEAARDREPLPPGEDLLASLGKAQVLELHRRLLLAPNIAAARRLRARFRADPRPDVTDALSEELATLESGRLERTYKQCGVDALTAELVRDGRLADRIVEANDGGRMLEALCRAHALLLTHGTQEQADGLRTLLPTTLPLPTWWQQYAREYLEQLIARDDEGRLAAFGLGASASAPELPGPSPWRGRPPPGTDLLAALDDDQACALHDALLGTAGPAGADLRARIKRLGNTQLHETLLDQLAETQRSAINTALDAGDDRALALALFEGDRIAPLVHEARAAGRLNEELRRAHSFLLAELAWTESRKLGRLLAGELALVSEARYAMPLLTGVVAGPLIYMDVGRPWESAAKAGWSRAVMVGGGALVAAWLLLFLNLGRRSRAPGAVTSASVLRAMLWRTLKLCAIGCVVAAVVAALAIETADPSRPADLPSFLRTWLVWSSLSLFLGIFLGLVLQGRSFVQEVSRPSTEER